MMEGKLSAVEIAELNYATVCVTVKRYVTLQNDAEAINRLYDRGYLTDEMWRQCLAKLGQRIDRARTPEYSADQQGPAGTASTAEATGGKG